MQKLSYRPISNVERVLRVLSSDEALSDVFTKEQLDMISANALARLNLDSDN